MRIIVVLMLLLVTSLAGCVESNGSVEAKFQNRPAAASPQVSFRYPSYVERHDAAVANPVLYNQGWWAVKSVNQSLCRIAIDQLRLRRDLWCAVTQTNEGETVLLVYNEDDRHRLRYGGVTNFTYAPESRGRLEIPVYLSDSVHYGWWWY